MRAVRGNKGEEFRSPAAVGVGLAGAAIVGVTAFITMNDYSRDRVGFLLGIVLVTLGILGEIAARWHR